jgi:hypothetical protein
MNWLAANAMLLEERHLVLGRFYQSPAGHRCRDELLIACRSTSTDPGILPDAVFVMMNPGDSEPLSGGDTAPVHASKHAPTRPDRTQYQVMRLMAHRGWNLVRVINLSDLRTPTSGKLSGLMAAYQATEGTDAHSIFSQSRCRKLEEALSRKPGAPIVAAWGLGRHLRPWAERALEALTSSSVIGIRGVGQTWGYRHPLPRNATAQAEWLREMSQLLAARK